ncbi:hypothetical protein MTR67_029406 [Solanum verrucosum]|uniref:Uncharacterized protein n=1 Tax=Solanum verrucosum TaxID=315347 RepID=A0AAF0TX90_SOLVR|nr:hypothetical protein MTR67_029406 [Solanum verrucosum]
MVVQNPQPAGPFFMPPVHWQVVDENLFNAIDEPVLWFSMTLPVTLHNSKLESMIGGAGTGPSGAGAGAGPSGAGAEPTGARASKRPKIGGV